MAIVQPPWPSASGVGGRRIWWSKYKAGCKCGMLVRGRGGRSEVVL
ncbi:hypothetical protein F383_36308 [Gossypium arboreum]|uniref:Uncharacterized protein n=1 Tax=Gossypium arboreum TaxID=29729 RepID=A0A0B0NDY0_GOSAR|nr:hypothetical protein F383_36308 [Gossypium arboreum]